MQQPHPVFGRPATASHIFKFVTNTVKRAVELAHVSSDFRDAVVNFSPDMWANIINFSDEKSKCVKCMRKATLTFPVVAATRIGNDPDLIEVLKFARSFSNHMLIHELLRAFADRLNRLPLPQLLAAVSTADLCAWLLNEPQPIAEAFDAKWIAAALLRQPQQQQPHILLDFARRVAALPAPLVGLASSGWSFFIAVFLFAAAASGNEVTTWLQQFPHRFSATHPEAREWFGQLVRARIGQQQQSDSFWLKDLAPALLQIVHETRNNNKDKKHQQTGITVASNAASLLFAPRLANFAVDLSGCVLEDCNLVASDFTKVVFKSAEHGEARLQQCVLEGSVVVKSGGPGEVQKRVCVVEGWISDEEVSETTKHLLQRGIRREMVKDFSCGIEWRSVAVSPDGNLIVGGGENNMIRLWDAANGNCLRELTGHIERVNSVAFSPDGKVIVSGSYDETVKLWDATAGTCVRTLTSDSKYSVNSIAFCPDGKCFVGGTADGKLKLWDLETGACLRTLCERNNTSGICCVAFSPDGKNIVSGGWDNTVKVWDPKTGSCRHTFPHAEAVRCVAYSPDGSMIASGDCSIIRLWDAVANSCLRTFQPEVCIVNSVSFCPDGKTIVSGDSDSHLRLWDVSTGKCIGVLRHSGWAQSVSYSPDGLLIASGGSGRKVQLWDPSTRNCVRAHRYGHKSFVLS